ncbi:ER lumen protein retaining receptor [Dillenia turbinata]|uniref:ER lumen protein retaining receptor n=1 Tax=Dillenia turbinata TaxID=194707 RepID=A0AAN8VUV3_9MAGN
MGIKRRKSTVNPLLEWVGKQPMKVKIAMAATSMLCGLIALNFLVKDHSLFYISSQAIHAAGILVLIYKLTTRRTCSGLSLKTQELTALFLVVRLGVRFLFEDGIHTILDAAILVSTLWVMYMIRVKLNSTYNKELDSLSLSYVVLPTAILAILIHPHSYFKQVDEVFWAFSTYMEAVSVLPQLRLMQNAKMVEPFTGHYVFALGVARFLGCGHWLIKIYETRGEFLLLDGTVTLWVPMFFLCEMVQTFILADFCYYYIKR